MVQNTFLNQKWTLYLWRRKISPSKQPVVVAWLSILCEKIQLKLFYSMRSENLQNIWHKDPGNERRRRTGRGCCEINVHLMLTGTLYNIRQEGGWHGAEYKMITMEDMHEVVDLSANVMNLCDYRHIFCSEAQFRRGQGPWKALKNLWQQRIPDGRYNKKRKGVWDRVRNSRLH